MISYELNQVKEDVIYAAAFVLYMPQLIKGKTLVNIPDGMRAIDYATHITLSFGPTQEFLDSLPMGEEFDITALKIVADDKAVAAHVTLPEELPFENEYPHVTLATAPGTSPVYSNELLSKFYQDSDPSITEIDVNTINFGEKKWIKPGTLHVKVGTFRNERVPTLGVSRRADTVDTVVDEHE